MHLLDQLVLFDKNALSPPLRQAAGLKQIDPLFKTCSKCNFIIEFQAILA